MTRWHASTELHTAGTAAATAVYTAAKLEAARASGLGLDAAAHLELEAGLSGRGLKDTSG